MHGTAAALQPYAAIVSKFCKSCACTGSVLPESIASVLSGIDASPMIKESAREVAKTCRGERVGVLATDGTIKTELYQKALLAEGVVPYVPGDAGQKLVMHEIYNCVKRGKPVDDAAWSKVQQELIDSGCRKAILACTELSVIKEEKKLSDYYIDAMKVLAVRSIEYMGKRVK